MTTRPDDLPAPLPASAAARAFRAFRRQVRGTRLPRLLAAVLALLALAPAAAASEGGTPAHGIAMHGEPALPPDFPHLPYANPDAPKGGTVTYGVLGTFDSLNPFIPRGTIALGLRDLLYGNLVYESLLDRNRDEPFSLYGLLAESVAVPEDRTEVTFHLDPRARFSDGERVTPQDVVFSWEILKEKGRPNYRTYYSKVARVERVGANGVRFVFEGGEDRELPLILGLMPILPSHAIDPETFDRTTLDPPVGSGPYVVAEVDPGKRLVLERDPDYWGRDLPINRGRYNADTIRFDYFRDQNAMFEAFKTGLVDVFLETDPTRWATGYDFLAVRSGEVVRKEVETGTPRGMMAFAFNTRREIFADPRVREAIGMLFDFEWINQNLLNGLFERTASYFENSALASTGRPASEAERALLEPFADAVRADILAGEWRPPVSDGSGRDRALIREALGLLREAGWRIRDGKLVNEATGEPMAFEILVATRPDERLALAFSRLLAPVGIEARVRYVDAAQYQSRLTAFDFDMIRVIWPSSLSPGNEQLFRWSTAAADAQGSFNYAGARSQAIDAMIAAMLAARDREAFEDAVRALDRVLLSGFYVVPLYHTPVQWVAHSSRLVPPDKPSLSGIELETWWVAPEADAD